VLFNKISKMAKLKIKNRGNTVRNVAGEPTKVVEGKVVSFKTVKKKQGTIVEGAYGFL